MPLGLDFSRSNQAIARFNQFLQYDLLDQKRSNRDMEIVQVQDRLMRERARESGEIEKEVAEYKSKLSDREAYLKAKLDIAKLPQADYWLAMAHLATDESLSPEYHAEAKKAVKELGDILPLLSQAYQNASLGIGTANDAFNALKGGGVEGLTNYMKESGMNIRARQVAQTAAGEQQLGYAKIAGEGEKDTAAAADKMSERFITQIGDTIEFLEAEGVQGEAALEGIYADAKVRDPLMSEYRGTALQFLNELKSKVIREGAGALSDGNVAFIAKVWNTPAVQGFVSENLTKVGGGVAGPGATSTAPTGRRPRPSEAQGGLPSPTTGATPSEDQAAYDTIRTTLINQKIEEFISLTIGPGQKASPEDLRQAKKIATQYVDENIMPSIRGPEQPIR